MEMRCVMAEKFFGNVTHFFSKIGVVGEEDAAVSRDTPTSARR